MTSRATRATLQGELSRRIIPRRYDSGPSMSGVDIVDRRRSTPKSRLNVHPYPSSPFLSSSRQFSFVDLLLQFSLPLKLFNVLYLREIRWPSPPNHSSFESDRRLLLRFLAQAERISL